MRHKFPGKAIAAKLARLEQQNVHLAQVIAAMLYELADDPEEGLKFRERDLLQIDPGDIEVAITRDDEAPSKGMVIVRLRREAAIGGVTPPGAA